ncbi:protein-tyrosine phosphatase [Strigomonas culicis]|uniref:Protein-tyrosine phosphatase n=1 Tax=Strigomonas culicis TaxID=28005 RepID=S9UQ73_9TRYP|nr:protein-tyrosine phosphatase [Strigomonas culicis]|eukprot:EPY31013.1 protein-tyrosine phosphatase [Strigomonas culicis]
MKPGPALTWRTRRTFATWRLQDARRTEVLYGGVFRSDTPSKIAKDKAHVLKTTYHLHRIVDFRGHDEALRAPYSFEGIKCVPLTIDTVHTFITSLSSTHGRAVEAADVRKASDRVCSTFLEDYARDLRKFFQVLLDAKGRAVMFHCTAGKDRTGIAAALLLSLLDVPKEDILADYLLSNEYLKCSIDDGSPHEVLGHPFTAEAVHELCSVHQSNLCHALRPAIEKYGSLKNYAKKKLSLSERDLNKLKEYYTRQGT